MINKKTLKKLDFYHIHEYEDFKQKFIAASVFSEIKEFAKKDEMELTPFVVSGLMLCFLWSGFIRSGLGFGGLVLTLPFALMVVDSPLDIMPLAVVHAFVVGISTVFLRFRNVDWMQLLEMIKVMAIPVLFGLFGLITIPETWLLLLVFGVVLMYSLNYIRPFIQLKVGGWSNTLVLMLGGYLSGLALIGSPLIVAVAGHRIERHRLRDSLLALWVVLSPPKLVILFYSGVDLHLDWQWWLLPVNLLGHLLGMKFHDHLLRLRTEAFYRWLGAVLMLVVLVGIYRVLTR